MLKKIICTILLLLLLLVSSCSFLKEHQTEIIDIGVTIISEVIKIYGENNITSDTILKDSGNQRTIKFKKYINNKCIYIEDTFQNNIVVKETRTICEN